MEKSLEEKIKEEEKNLFGKLKDFGKRNWYKIALPLLSLFFIPNTAKADRYKITINHPDKWERITYRETDADSGDIWVKDLHSNEPIANAEMIWENLDTNLYKIFYTDDNGHAIGSLPSGIEEEIYNNNEGIRLINKRNGVFLDHNKKFEGGLYDKAGRQIGNFNGKEVFVSTKNLNSGIYFIKPNGYESSKITVADGLVVGVSDNLLSKIRERNRGLFSCSSNIFGPKEFSEKTYSSKGIATSIEEFVFTMLEVDSTFMDFYNIITFRGTQFGTARWEQPPIFPIDTTTYNQTTLNNIIWFINNEIPYMTQGLISNPNIVLTDSSYSSPHPYVWQVRDDGTGNSSTLVKNLDTNGYTIEFVDMAIANNADLSDIYQEGMHGSGFLYDSDILPSVMNEGSPYSEFQPADSMAIEILYNRAWGNKYPDIDPQEYWFNNGKNKNTTWNKELKVKEENINSTASLKYY